MLPARALLLLLVLVSPAAAGMPVIRFTDVGRMRLETLSFLLVLIPLLALMLRWLWNGLRKDFPRLPLLTFRGALALLGLWGVVSLVLLALISGARELFTPQAWTATGATYKPTAVVAVEETRRREALEDLRDALWHWADAHEGRLPQHEFGDELPERRWRVPGTNGIRYRFRPMAMRGSTELMAYEPDVVPEPRLGLFGDGTVRPFGKQDLVITAPGSISRAP